MPPELSEDVSARSGAVRSFIIVQSGATLFAILVYLLLQVLPGLSWRVCVVSALGTQMALAQGWSAARGEARWWRWIHGLFGPAIVSALWLELSAWFYLAGFIGLWLIFGRADRDRVPLFLSGQTTIKTLVSLLPAQPLRLLDLGCGTGSVLRGLRQQGVEGEFCGVEHAWGPFAVALLRCLFDRQCRVLRQDLWSVPLADYDVVYVFLSPAPMADIWAKAKREMKPGALLISNSFAAPGVLPSQCVEVGNAIGSRLFVYVM